MSSFERYNCDHKKIGIRVIVDGRCNGVREKIEGQTYELAENAKKLLEKNLRYVDGKPVQCVIGICGVGSATEAAKVSAQFNSENVGAIISVSRAFAYAAELMELDDGIPQAIWGYNGSERPGAVYLAAATAVSDQKGIPVFKIYGQDIQNADDLSIPEDVQEKLLRFGRCAIALAELKGKGYLSLGGTCMGIGGSIVDQEFFRSYLGMPTITVDMCELTRRMELGIYDHQEFDRALAWVKNNCREMPDPNPVELRQSREKKDQVWETIIKMTLIIRDLMTGNQSLERMGFSEEALGRNAFLAGFQGQRQWTDFMPNGDFSEAILNSSFDWDGKRQPYTIATENDSLNAATMLMGTLLTGTAQMFCDVRAFWSSSAVERGTGTVLDGLAKNGFLYLTNSGSSALDGTMASTTGGEPCIKPYWDMTDTDVQACLDNTSWGAGKLATFRGGGFSSSFLSKGGVPLTMLRINMIKGVGPVLQLAEGFTVSLPENVENYVVSRTDPTWPKTFFVPRLTGEGSFTSVFDFMDSWGANHCSLCYGHVGAEFVTLASMLRIPVCSHNLTEKEIFRPSLWNMVGGKNTDADFRACGLLGPIYGKY